MGTKQLFTNVSPAWGRLVREGLANKGWIQAEAGRRAGVDPVTICHASKGGVGLQKNVIAITRALGLDPAAVAEATGFLVAPVAASEDDLDAIQLAFSCCPELREAIDLAAELDPEEQRDAATFLRGVLAVG